MYNEYKSLLITTAKWMLDLCIERLSQKEERCMRLENAINPLLDDEDQVALSYVLDNITNGKLKPLPAEPQALQQEIRQGLLQHRQEPNGFGNGHQKVKKDKYHNREEFLLRRRPNPGEQHRLQRRGFAQETHLSKYSRRGKFHPFEILFFSRYANFSFVIHHSSNNYFFS
jgi:hypothetical protein